MTPARQSFHADAKLRPGAEDWLVMHFERPCRQRIAQFDGQPELRNRLLLHHRIEFPEAVLPVRLGAIERQIGVAHHIARAASRGRGARAADADAERDCVTLDLERLARNGADAIGERNPGVGVIRIDWSDDREFVAPESHGEVLRGAGRCQTLCENAQRLVADRVSVAVIDVLEAVEIDQQDCEGRSGILIFGKVAVHFLQKRRAIAEACQPIVTGNVGKPHLAVAQQAIRTDRLPELQHELFDEQRHDGKRNDQTRQCEFCTCAPARQRNVLPGGDIHHQREAVQRSD